MQGMDLFLRPERQDPDDQEIEPNDDYSERNILKDLREKAELSQKQLAQLMGTHQANVSRMENETLHKRKLGKVLRYIEALGFDLQLYAKMHKHKMEINLNQDEVVKDRDNKNGS